MTIKPGKNFLSVLRLRLFLILIIPAFICGIISVFSLLAALITGAVVLAVFLFFWVWYLPRFVRSCSVILSDTSLAVTRGVFLRRKYVMPDSRTVYAERVRTPLGRLFGLETVNIHLVKRILIFDGLEKADADTVLAHLAEASRNG